MNLTEKLGQILCRDMYKWMYENIDVVLPKTITELKALATTALKLKFDHSTISHCPACEYHQQEDRIACTNGNCIVVKAWFPAKYCLGAGSIYLVLSRLIMHGDIPAAKANIKIILDRLEEIVREQK